ncbi:MAG: hypothetical protein CSA09_00485 [Candidatus Contendobacter odensis]|uniref:PilY1 beta-propeller domain-containing protein n=1 Tax=Candidatus Contendibacter odensensis TaxID=1400860 RepID=A0A2G6PFP8_9GAMM|nr:MAG: hypothetical protein CSA09_00485 [Candidatus Contendobacter odensis]
MKKMLLQHCKKAVIAALLSGGLLHFTVANAALLDISKVPLFVGIVGVVPNVFITLDDSGSMDWEFTNNHFWTTYAYDWDVRKNQYHESQDRAANISKIWWGYVSAGESYTSDRFGKKFSYYFNNDDNVYDGTCTSGYYRPIYSCNFDYTFLRPNPDRTAPNDEGILWDWRIFSSDLNVLYYDPKTKYEPWIGIGTDAVYTNVRSNPQSGTAGYSKTRNLSDQDFYYAVWSDDKGWNPDHSTPRGGNIINMTETPNEKIDLWDTYTLYTVKKGAGDTITVKTFETTYCPVSSPYPSITDEPRCYYKGAYKKGRLLVNQVGTTKTLTGTGAHAELGGLSVAQTKTNIANWYSYHRRRSFVAKGSLAKVINQFPNLRYGITVLNKYNGDWPNYLFVEAPVQANPPFIDHNNNLIEKMHGFKFTRNGTPLRKALRRAGQYFEGTLSSPSGKSSPILPEGAGGECQQNFTLLTTDGFWNGGSPGSTIGNSDGDGADGTTLADVAHHYYKTDLSPLENKVKTTPFDQANWQHMVTFTVAFGVEGELKYPTDSGWPTEARVLDSDGKLSESGDWGNPAGKAANKIDDMWHAAYNSRGGFLSARNPDELVDGLSRILRDISARAGSASAISLNAGFVTNQRDAISYLARFNSKDWIGQLVAVNIKADGTFDTGTPVWDTLGANSAFARQSPASRKIFTSKPDGDGIEFLWGNLDASQQAALNTHPITGTVDGKGEQRLAFLRGKGVVEGDSGWLEANKFRERSSMLGDIVHSDPFYVEGNPSVVYVSANDGMLHAFDAADGKELFAYIPRVVLGELNQLTHPNYAHFYTVDGSPVVKDIGGRKILIGTMRGGGQALYALDVTNPDSFSASDVLWEFSDADDKDLGYTFSKPTIAKMANGKYAAIIGNGYNNTEADGHASDNGYAMLYVFGLKDDGSLDYVKKMSTATGSNSPGTVPNGLATPVAAIDPEATDYTTVKYVYGGDLQGNLWKFDVSDSTPNNWEVAYNGKPLFKAVSRDTDATGNYRNQPITTRPEVDVHPYDGYLLFFGTGKYFESSDNTSGGRATQALYAVWDRDWSDVSTAASLLPLGREHLLKQEIIANVSGHYVTSDHRIYWNDKVDENPAGGSVEDGVSDKHMGWFVDLVFGPDNKGERQVTNGLLRNKRVIFNTIITSSDICDAGGSGNQIILDAVSGSRLKKSPFKDVDLVEITEDGNTVQVPVSSKPSDVGMLSEPRAVENLQTGAEYIVSLGSTGRPASNSIDPTEGQLGRQSWRQLLQQ